MEKIEKKLWKKAKRYIAILRIVPFVRMVGVCNNLAFSSVDEKSDIDLFVIAKSGRMFFVRTFVTLILHILGVRRHGDKVAGRFCLSFFIDDSDLNLEKIAIENDVYLANWICSMAPLIDDGVSDDFCKKNAWAKRYFEGDSSFSIRNDLVLGRSDFLKGIFGYIFSGRFGDFCEKKLAKWQMKRAKNKSLSAGEGASLIINEHMLKFHNIDRRKRYMELWNEHFSGLKITDERFLTLQKFL